jgi:hypothetical protein
LNNFSLYLGSLIWQNLKYGFCTFILILPFISIAQQVKIISQDKNSELSYYDICRISDNEFWIGGEDGILKKIDTLGNISTIKFDVPAFDILKMAFRNDSVWLAGTHGNLYSYSLNDSSVRKVEFPKRFHRLCFYDLLSMPDGSLLLCGGNTKIPAAAKVAPYGFILKKFPVSELRPEYHWRRWLAFAWSLQSNGEDLFAAIYKVPAFKSEIKSKHVNAKKWDKSRIVDGLVHSIYFSGYSLLYCGASSVAFSETGMAGTTGRFSNHWVMNKSGCVFDIKTMEGQIVACDYSGNILHLSDDNISSVYCLGTSLYELAFLSATRIVVVGKNQSIVLVDFKF